MVCDSKILPNRDSSCLYQYGVLQLLRICSLQDKKNYVKNCNVHSQNRTSTTDYSTLAIHIIHSTTDHFLDLTPLKFKRDLTPPRALGLSWARALEMPLTTHSSFLYFREIWGKRSHWPGCQSALFTSVSQHPRISDVLTEKSALKSLGCPIAMSCRPLMLLDSNTKLQPILLAP